MVTPDGRTGLDSWPRLERRQLADERRHDEHGATETGVVVGTPHYLAPEVLRGSVANGKATWAPGVLHEMASGLCLGERPASELASAIRRTPAAPDRSLTPACIRRCPQSQASVTGERARCVRHSRRCRRSVIASATTAGRDRAPDRMVAILAAAISALGYMHRVRDSTRAQQRQMTRTPPGSGRHGRSLPTARRLRS